MRVLLINSNRLRNPPVMPIGLCYIASSVEEAGHKVHVLDLCFSSYPAQAIKSSIAEFNPEVIGVSIRNIDKCTLVNQELLIEEILKDIVIPIKRNFIGPIVVGGPAVGISGDEILNYLDLEYGIVGDGEKAMIEFLSRIEQSEPLVGLKGMIIRQNGRIVESNEPDRPTDLDLLPLPNVRRYIDLQPYQRLESPLQIQTKRGCELHCTYCTYNVIEGKRYRLRDPQKVADEIELLVTTTGIRCIEFTDSIFNIPVKHAKSVLRAIIEKKIDIELRAMSVNPGAVDEELVDLMIRAGFRYVDLGIEAGNDKMLTALGKNFREKDILYSAKLLQQRGIPIRFYLLLGAPGETYHTLKRTFDTLNKAVGPWDIVIVGMGLRVYKGSPIALHLLKENPGITADNFFRPFFLPLKGMEIGQFGKIVKRETLRKPNYYFYSEGKEIHPLIRSMIIKLMKLIAPRQPIWQIYIFVQRINIVREAKMLMSMISEKMRREPRI